MKLPQSRLPCRAHNHFSPAIVLWQYFVAPTRPLYHARRQSSTAPESAHNSSPPQHATTPAQDAVVNHAVESPISRKTSSSRKTSHRISAADTTPVAVDSQTWRGRATAAQRSSEDYEGVAVQPVRGTCFVRDGAQPWALEEQERALPFLDRLALEINSFYTYSRPDPHEQTVRDHVIYKIKTFVEKRSPEYEIEVFGSEKTGLAFATSDIDLRLKPRHIEQPPSETIDTPTQNSPANPKQPNRKQNAPLLALRRLYHHGLRTHRSYLLPTFRYARYPLINLLDKQSNLSIQIVLAHDTSQSEELMARYAGDYPYLNELYFVLKAALEIRGLTDVFRGGLGSYPLLMMLVASIKLNPHPRNDAAGALINFLEFYGSFDNTAKGISIDPPELFDKAEVTVMSAKTKSKIEKGQTQSLPPYMLTLRDPANPANDLGRKTTGIKHIQATFRQLATDLKQREKSTAHATLLAPLVGPFDVNHQEHRNILHEFAEQLQQTKEKAKRPKKAKGVTSDVATGGKEESLKDSGEQQEVHQAVEIPVQEANSGAEATSMDATSAKKEEETGKKNV